LNSVWDDSKCYGTLKNTSTTFMFWDNDCIKVEIRYKAIAPAFLTCWNILWHTNLVWCNLFGSFQTWYMSFSWRHHFPCYIRTLFYYLIISFPDLVVIIGDNVESIFRRFCRLLKKKTCKRRKERSDLSHLLSLLSSSSLPYFLYLLHYFHDGTVLLNLIWSKETKAWELIKLWSKSNLFSLLNSCFEYWMFFYAYFSWLSRLITRRPASLLFVAIYC